MGKQLPGIVEILILESPEAPQDPWTNQCWSLWIQVLSQAVRDAENNINSGEMRCEKRRAISWLCGHSEDFCFVCDLCGFDPRWASQKFRKYFEGGFV